VRAAAQESWAEFLQRLRNGYWRGLAVKCQGARVVKDTGRYLARVVERFNKAVFSDAFVLCSLDAHVAKAQGQIDAAAEAQGKGAYAAASVALLKSVTSLTSGCYAVWRTVPQSLMRYMTRFRHAAERVGQSSVSEVIMRLARVNDDDCLKRCESVPERGRREIDMMCAIRQETEPGIERLAVVRDLLHATAHLKRHDPVCDLLDGWQCLEHNEETVARQHEAAETVLQYLQMEAESLR
jgi:hypothetical protein